MPEPDPGRRRARRPLRRGPRPHRDARRAALPGGPDRPVDARRLARRSGTAPTSPGSSRRSCSPTTSRASRRSRTRTGSCSTRTTRRVGPALRPRRARRDHPARRPRRRRLPRQRRRPDARPPRPRSTSGSLEQARRHRRARLPPRAAAPGAAADGHQARAVAATRSARRTPAPPSAVATPDPLRLGRRRGRPGRDRPRGRRASPSTTSCPRHQQCLEPFRLADRLVTNGEWLEFMADGGYRAPRALALRRLGQGAAPRAGTRRSTGPRSTACWFEHTLSGTWPVDPGLPVSHVSYYEADAYATWAGSGCRPRPSGSTPSSPTVSRRADAPATSPTPSTFHPRAGRRRRPAACARSTATAGSGRRSAYLALPRLPPAGRRRRRVQRQVHVRPDGAARRLRAHAARPRPGHLPQLLPAGLALGAVRACAWPTAATARMTAREPVVIGRCSTPTGPSRQRCVDDVRRGLGVAAAHAARRSGSTTTRARELFDEITRLPEYYPTEAERAILREHADEIVDRRATRRPWSSSAAAPATRPALLLDAFADAGQLARFVPVDVSEGTLRDAAEQIARALPGLAVEAVVGDFTLHLGAPARAAAGGWSRSSAARSATSTSRSGAPSSGRSPTSSSPATGCCSAPTWSRTPTG